MRLAPWAWALLAHFGSLWFVVWSDRTDQPFLLFLGLSVYVITGLAIVNAIVWGRRG